MASGILPAEPARRSFCVDSFPLPALARMPASDIFPFAHLIGIYITGLIFSSFWLVGTNLAGHHTHPTLRYTTQSHDGWMGHVRHRELKPGNYRRDHPCSGGGAPRRRTVSGAGFVLGPKFNHPIAWIPVS